MSTENQNAVSGEVSFDDLQEGFTFDLPTIEATPELPDMTQVDLTIAEPEIKEEEQKQEPIKMELNSETSNFYSNLVKKNLEKGIWEDVIIKDSEDEEGTKLSELSNLTEEEYIKLVEDQEAIKKEDLKEKYISIDGLTEEKKLILDIVKNGGDLKELFKAPEQMQKPFDEALGWDLDNEEHQYAVVYQQYKAQGLSDQRAQLLANEDRKEFTLDTKAKEIVDYHQRAFTENLKNINDNLVKEQLEEQNNLKTYRSELTKQYKALGVPEASIKKYVDVATKPTDNGFVVDTLFEESMKDPKKAADIIFYLTDPEKFLAEKMKGTKVKTQIDTMRVINRIPRESAKKETQTEEQKGTSAFQFDIPRI